MVSEVLVWTLGFLYWILMVSLKNVYIVVLVLLIVGLECLVGRVVLEVEPVLVGLVELEIR